MTSTVQPVKDEDNELPVPSAWRPVFHEIVAAFVGGDYQLKNGVTNVEAVAEETATGFESYVADYGETLVDLTDETWETSIASWQGQYWQVLVDLRTEAEGASDLVLHARVYERGTGYRFELGLVYVP